MNNKVRGGYTSTQLKFVYSIIDGILEDEKKVRMANAFNNCDGDVIECVEQILSIQDEYSDEMNKWWKALKIDEITDKEKKMEEESFKKFRAIFQPSSFNT